MSPTQDLAERFAIMAANAPGAPDDQVARWAYADVARQYTDRARALPGQLPADPRVRTATQAVRRCLSPHRDEMVGPKDVAVAALETLAAVLVEVEVEIATSRARAAIAGWLDVERYEGPLHMRKAGNSWSFWVAEEDDTGFVKPDGTVEFYGLTEAGQALAGVTP